MRYNSRPSGALSASAKWGLVLVAIAAIAAVAYFMVKDEVNVAPKLQNLPAPVAAQPAAVAEPAKPAAKAVYNEPKPAPIPEPLPDLNQSDATVIAALKGLNINGLVEMVIPEEILRKFVLAVKQVEEGNLLVDYRPITSPQGAFVADSFNVKVSGGDLGEQQEVEQFRVSPKNYLRYTLYVRVLAALDSDAAMSVYKRFYPLMNQAYQDMGVAGDNFHSVMIRAIDKVLAAPDASGDLLLVRPKVYYEFADPALEHLPGVYKLLLRMGPDNEAQIKSSLKNIRTRLLQS